VRKAVRILLVFLLFFAVVSSAATAVVFSLLYGRSDTIPPTEPVYSEEDALLYPRSAVRFDSGGETLRGWLYGAGSDLGLIVVVNGMNSGADTHLSEIRYFVDGGFAVLAYDGTGVRESGGQGVRGLGQPRLDLEAALAYVRSQSDLQALPVLLYGHSAGGYAAAIAAGEHTEVAGAVCLAAFDRPVELMAAQARRHAGWITALEVPFLRLQYRLLFGPGSDASAAEALSRAESPFLIVMGSEDEAVPAECSLYGKRDLIQNPLGEYLLVSGEHRSGHSTLWLTEEAAACREAVLAGETEPEAGFCSQADGEFMAVLLAFFLSAAEENGLAA